MKKRIIKLTAHSLLLSMLYQLALPSYAYALTTGPSQPEVQSFEPVGTTEMVDMFTGDFTYNIPLMDVEGYPINIYYHAGINIEQEASWVGLGWNINPGEINRSVRGLPDDFNGETIEKKIKIEDEKTYRVGMGIDASLEVFGFNPGQYGVNLSLGAGGYIQYNNYRGVSVGTNTGVTISTPVASAGINMGIGSQTGSDVDLSAGLSLPIKISQDVGAGIGVSGGTGFNSRSGLKGFSFGVSSYANANVKYQSKKDKDGNSKAMTAKGSFENFSYGSSIPVGMQNYVPVITNASVLKSFQFQARFGGEVFYVYPNVYMTIMQSDLKFEKDGTRQGYGYMYSENANDESILDFSRHNEGVYNNTLQNLPLASMTYDIYSVSGHGTGGIFRPFRNDIGTVYDPLVNPPKSSSQEVKIEGGVGNLFEIGTDMTFYDNENRSGPWKRLPFRGEDTNSLYEKVFFKQGGELTYNHQRAFTGIFNNHAEYLKDDEISLKGKGGASYGSLPSKLGNAHVYTGSSTDRTSRANLISFFTGSEASIDEVAQHKNIISHEKFQSGSNPFYNPANPTLIQRTGGEPDDRKAHHVSEFSQILPDGRRYIYGIPAINNMTRELTFSVNPSNANLSTGIVTFAGNDNTENNDVSTSNEKFYSSTATPAYAHSYLLTSVLSTDYVDILGDGPTDDDLGNFVKFNYTLWDSDFRWKAPYGNSEAQYMPGFWSDKQDDKGSYVIGSRELWHVRSIESKNYIAEFYVTPRTDGKGVTAAVLDAASSLKDGNTLHQTKGSASVSYQLDSIKLFNKHSRYLDTTNAVPIKTVIFKYDNSLCNGVPNGTSGKLTLKKIFIKYGNSQKNLLSPYEFTYNNTNPNYNFANKDRWGNYKEPESGLTNYEFPYAKQEGSNINEHASAWNLTNIKLPSGGTITVDYEADDYSYVQDRRTMQMFRIKGVGSSTNYEQRSALYESKDKVNDYIYFERRQSAEKSGVSLWENYLEGTDILYYSFNVDIANNGSFEHVKGYAKVLDVGICSGNSQYGYIKVKKESTGKENFLLHPATIYGLNIGRYYLPHIIYPGFKGGNGGPLQILDGLLHAATEFPWQNPFQRFINDKKGKNIKIDKSWVRLNVPGLTKKGGGCRVKQLTLNDSWQKLSSNPDNAEYGKTYEYTIEDSKWGTISSGVASYEPMVGGDENPFKRPVPYTADAGRLLPAIDFFQEEPFGESFFPSPVVGYSKITVKSIHADNARSAQSEDEYLFYTAKDFPIEVDYTPKDAPPPIKSNKLRKKSEEVKAMQGYALRFNDMHGKPRSQNYYLIKTDGSDRKRELVKGTTYNYNLTNEGKLNNTVKAVVRQRGTPNTYNIQDVVLGEEMDFTIDSRERHIRSYRRNVDINVNVVLFAVIPIPIPTAFFPDKEEVQQFSSLVSTKIIQKYGIVKSIEDFDHGAKTTVENVLYDAETGTVLLTKVNNEFGDGVYDLTFPAYWAYEGMGPAYTNIGYQSTGDSLEIKSNYYGRLYLKDKNKFTHGDEVLLSYKKNGQTYTVKAWLMEERWVMSSNTPSSPWPYPYEIFGSNAMPPYQTFHTCYVVPRYIYRNGTPNWPGLAANDVITDTHIKIVRSGRRNMLNEYVQKTVLSKNPYSTSIAEILGGKQDAYENVIDATVNVFTDNARSYGTRYADSISELTIGDYDPRMFPVDIDTFEILNWYVLGLKGNYRLESSANINSARKYTQNNIRYDGTFNIYNKLFWNNTNGSGSARSILTPTINTFYWQPNPTVTKYDPFGNAIEERDIIGKFGSAQYGHNRALPIAVAANVRQRNFAFDGFEDYKNLVPDNLYKLYFNSYYNHTPFSSIYKSVQSSITRNGQKYNKLNLSNSNATITNETSHSGFYCLKSQNAHSVSIGINDPEQEENNLYQVFFPNIKSFSFVNQKKYVVNIWVKPVSGNINIDALAVEVDTNTYQFVLKTGNVDGWYLAECIVDLSNNPNTVVTATIDIPNNLYLDDVRFIPVDANMKSFVYDALTHKLIAQLDENHFTTFFEYDQEGLLIRVKKETEKGITTVSENRRSNSKK